MEGKISAGKREAWHTQVPGEERENGRHPRTDACLTKRCSTVPVEREVCVVGRRSTSPSLQKCPGSVSCDVMC